MLESRRQYGEMTTAKAIEAMSDAGAFEILATRVLRQTDPDYARIEHLGVNADGKTIKNPLDGFCKIPGSNPPRYVMAAFSTDVVKKIERKLLFDHRQSEGTKYKDADDGDLIKAARKATAIRNTDCSAEFIFTFCTNKQPDDEVMQAGYAAGESLGIEVRFLARSSIRDHLDTTPNGQWLRKEHLGVTADRLSISLLRELAAKSAENYFSELFFPRNCIIETTTTKRLSSLSLQGRPSVNVLIGSSGSGKSVAAYKVLSDVISNNGIALWLPAEVTINSLSLDASITAVLQSLHPTLGPESGKDSMVLTTNKNIPFLLVVDDVNRTENAAQTIRKLINWHRQIAPGEACNSSAQQKCYAPHLIIPVWNHHWASIASRYRSERTIREISSQPMTLEEALDCLKAYSNHRLDQQTVSEVVKRLEYDPILIGLWGELHANDLVGHLDAEASNLIRTYIQNSIEETSADSIFLMADIRIAFEALIQKMFEERDFYPTWSSISKWLSDSQVNAVRRLCVSGRVCSLSYRNNVDRFEFRHDRLLETALSTPLRACLSDIEKNRDVVSDPFFTASVARAIVESDDAVKLASKLIGYAPLAVLQSLRHITEINTPLAKATVALAQEWLVEATTSERVPPEMVFAASQILAAIQNPLILSVTESIRDNRNFSCARLVNGDAIRGKFFVINEDFSPSINNWFVEDTITRACQLHYDHLCEEISADLNRGASLSEPELYAAFILAGYIGGTSLAEPILQAWNQNKGKKCLIAALWASMRCATSPEITLAPMLDFWATLSDEQSEYGNSDDPILFYLKFCMRHGLDETVISFLITCAEHNKRLSSCITTLLQKIDHPISATFIATRIAHIEKEIQGTGKWSPWADICRDEWDPLISYYGNSLSDASRNAIVSLWHETEEEWLKKSLLRTWIKTTNSAKELAWLPNELAISNSVLWRRAYLGDASITDFVLERVEDEPAWWDVIPLIWTNRFINPLDRAFSTLAEEISTDFFGNISDEHFFLSEVVFDIPFEVAEELLLKYWESLKFSATFVRAALFVGGESLLSATQKTIKDAPNSWEPFRHVGIYFGFTVKFGRKERIPTDKHVDALLPYVLRLNDSDLMVIAEWLVKHKREDDFHKFVLPEINRRIGEQGADVENSLAIPLRQMTPPTDADLLNALSEIGNEKYAWYWCKEATERGDSPERVRSILRTWFLEEASLTRLRIFAKIVMELGYREDVKDLEKYQAEYGNESTKTLVDGAAFWVHYRTLS